MPPFFGVPVLQVLGEEPHDLKLPFPIVPEAALALEEDEDPEAPPDAEPLELGLLLLLVHAVRAIAATAAHAMSDLPL